jgi:hypothetical protein
MAAPMTRRPRLLAAIAVAALVLLGVSVYLQSWGGVALLLVGAGGYVWYRVQVARSEAAEQFFGDMGDETRLTGLQAGSPSEMPLDRTIPPRKPPPQN